MQWIVLTSTIAGITETDRIEHCIGEIARNASNESAEELYLLTKDAVYGYALSILKNTHDAEDVFHDCFLSVYRSAQNYVPNGKPMAWIFTVARNLCLSKLRARSRFSQIPEEDWENYLESNERISPEDKIVLEHCLKDLADDERDILLLHVLSGMKHREIAELTDRHLSTILSKYHRTLRKMRALLEEDR